MCVSVRIRARETKRICHGKSGSIQCALWQVVRSSRSIQMHRECEGWREKWTHGGGGSLHICLCALAHCMHYADMRHHIIAMICASHFVGRWTRTHTINVVALGMWSVLCWEREYIVYKTRSISLCTNHTNVLRAIRMIVTSLKCLVPVLMNRSTAESHFCCVFCGTFLTICCKFKCRQLLHIFYNFF